MAGEDDEGTDLANPAAFRSAEARVAYDRLYGEALALAPVPVVESAVETSFGTTHLLTAGDPSMPPLVAMHAKACSSTSWLPLLPALTAAHHVTMIDAVGDVNKSAATRPITKADQVVAWLDDVLGALSIPRASIIGASIGAWMATHYAMARPAGVDRLALIGPAGIVSRQHPRWLLGAMIKAGIGPTGPKLESFLDSMVMPATRPRLRESPWRPFAQQFVDGTIGFRSGLVPLRPVPCNLDRLAASGIPVLAMIGRDETLHDGPTMAERFKRELPDAHVELVEDANHLIFIDQPQLVSKLVTEFLD